MRFVRQGFDSRFLTLIVNGFISVGISLVCVFLLQIPWLKFDIKSMAYILLKKGDFDQIEDPVIRFKKKEQVQE